MSKVYSFRFTDDVAAKLEANAKMLKMSNAAYLALKIEQDFDSMNGNPKVKEAVELLEQMAMLAEDFELLLK